MRANQLVFTIPGGKDYIRDKKWDKNVSLDKITQINNGVDLEEFEYNRTHYITQDDDLTDKSTFKVVYMGSVRYANHLKTLIEAAVMLKNKGETNIKILVYGKGTEKETLQQKCNELGINVIFKGYVSKRYIPYILEQSNLNLINVKKTNIIKYGCSWNKLFEYMASGKPILCNLPTAYDLIEKKKIGITKEFTSSEEYADAIIEFKNMPKEKYSKFCNNALAAVKEYDYPKLANKVEAVCLKAIGD